MPTQYRSISLNELKPFDRNFFSSDESIAYVGSGAIGGKASGLAFISDILARAAQEKTLENFTIGIPKLVVLPTDIFDRFMEHNRLHDIAHSRERDEVIGNEFLQAELPPEIVGDLRGLIADVHTPLAVRSSSMLEDDLNEPFAGVYATKMIPNNQPDTDARFRKLMEAIKFVYASAFFGEAKDYIASTGHSSDEEKMAVIIQEVVGRRFDIRFYPHISGVGRSFNYYPLGHAKPEEGVVDLALGLGKTIVEGGLVWSYSPAHPTANPPVSSAQELLKLTQTEFWAINMGKPPEHDPIKETEYMIRGSLTDAEYDNTLTILASTYLHENDRIVPGTNSTGPRILNFSPLLVHREIPLNDTLLALLACCEDAVGKAVEIEFAITIDPRRKDPPFFGFLQVRPMMVSDATVDIDIAELEGDNVIIATDRVMGNGVIEGIQDIVYVMPDRFEAKHTQQIARELESMNRMLLTEGRPYLLIGFGRWGSSDPWLGIPVNWSQVSGAKVLVEATLPHMNVELSQGSHFFHNLSSFQIHYFPVHHAGKHKIDWEWLDCQTDMQALKFVKHVRTYKPVTVKADGRSRRGVICS